MRPGRWSACVLAVLGALTALAAGPVSTATASPPTPTPTPTASSPTASSPTTSSTTASSPTPEPTARGTRAAAAELPLGYRASPIVSVDGQRFSLGEGANPISPEDDRIAGQVEVPHGQGSDPQAAVFSVRERTVRVLHPPGSLWSTAVDINRHGQVTGTAHFYDTGESTFVWDPATNRYRMLGSLGGYFSRPSAINDSGVVVGLSSGDLGEHAFVSDPAVDHGRMRDLGALPGDSESKATAVNDAGTVVGWSGGCDICAGRGFVWSPGAPTLHDLGHLGGDNYTWPIDVNDHGSIVGQSGYEPGPTGQTKATRAFVYSPSTRQLRALPSRPDQDAAATAINVHGVIVGRSVSRTLHNDQALLWNACGKPVTVLDEGLYGTSALGINRYEHVIGYDDSQAPTFWRRNDGPCRPG